MNKNLGRFIVIIILMISFIFFYKSIINFHYQAYGLSIAEFIGALTLVSLGDEISSHFI